MAQTVTQRITLPFDGHIIGEGYNSSTGERVGTALNVGSIGDDAQANGQTGIYSFLMVTSQESLEKALNFSAQLDAQYGIFSGGAKFDFAQKNAVNSQSTYVLASCHVQNALRTGSNFTPTPAAQGVLRTNDTSSAAFREAYGDRYCEALQTGGEYHALIRVTSSNSAYQSNIAASLHAEMSGLVMPVGGSFEASFSTALADTSSHTSVDIEIFQMGGQGAQLQMPGANPDKIQATMNSFATYVVSHPVAYEAQLLTYDTLALAGAPPEEVADRDAVIADCQQKKQKYWSAISDLEFLQTPDGPLIFDGLPPAAALAALEDQFRTVLGALMTFALGVATGATPPTPFVPSNEPILPVYSRKSSTTFASWWVRRGANDATLTNDELTLISEISAALQPLLSVRIETATPDAIQAAATVLQDLNLQYVGSPFTKLLPLSSLAALPNMLSSSLRSVDILNHQLSNLEGLETFSRIENLSVQRSALEDVSAIAPLAGLLALNLMHNRVTDISALAGMNQLQTLQVAGNEIVTLEPLRNMKELSTLVLAASASLFVADAAPGSYLENPVNDGSALKALPAFSSPFVMADKISVKLVALPTDNTAKVTAMATLDAGSEIGPLEVGVAIRVGQSTSFDLTLGGGPSERIVFAGGYQPKSAESIFIGAVLFKARQKIGIFCVSTDAPSQTVDRFSFGKSLTADMSQAIPLDFLGFSLDMIVEAVPMA